MNDPVEEQLDVTDTSASLEAAQTLVGGYIERLSYDGGALDIWMNEDGVGRGLPITFRLPGVGPDFTGTPWEGAAMIKMGENLAGPGEPGFYEIRGDVFFARSNDEGEWADLTDDDVAKIRATMRAVRALPLGG